MLQEIIKRQQEEFEKNFCVETPEEGKIVGAFDVQEELMAYKAPIIQQFLSSCQTQIVTAMKEECEKRKFPSYDSTISKDMPSTTYPTAKPAHESNEVLMQHAHNEALSSLLSYLEDIK